MTRCARSKKTKPVRGARTSLEEEREERVHRFRGGFSLFVKEDEHCCSSSVGRKNALGKESDFGVEGRTHEVAKERL